MELGVTVPHRISNAYDKIRSSTFITLNLPQRVHHQPFAGVLYPLIPFNTHHAVSIDHRTLTEHEAQTEPSKNLMTATRPSNRRGLPPHALSLNSPQPSSSSSNKPSVSLEEWDSKAPLGDFENTSVVAVKAELELSTVNYASSALHQYHYRCTLRGV